MQGQKNTMSTVEHSDACKLRDAMLAGGVVWVSPRSFSRVWGQQLNIKPTDRPNFFNAVSQFKDVFTPCAVEYVNMGKDSLRLSL